MDILQKHFLDCNSRSANKLYFKVNMEDELQHNFDDKKKSEDKK